MQIRLVFALAIYLASYLPLSIILLIQDIDYDLIAKPFCFDLATPECQLPLKNFWPAAIGVGICCVGLAMTLASLNALKPKEKIQLSSARHVPADLMNYVLPYVVSFMGLGYAETDKLAGFLVFLAWIFLITYKSGQVIMNPVLTVFGWRLHEIEYTYPGGKGESHSAYCLSRPMLEPGETHTYAVIQEVLIIKGDDHAPGA